jgi:hypothetical protein
MAKTRRPQNNTNESVDALIARIAQLEKPSVYAWYYLSANFAASSTIPVNFDSMIEDTHGAVTTSPTAWKFTVPAGESGLYKIEVDADSSAATTVFWHIFKGGAKYLSKLGYTDGGLNGYNTCGSATIRLAAGEYIDIRPGGSITVRGGANPTGDNVARVMITKVG